MAASPLPSRHRAKHEINLETCQIREPVVAPYALGGGGRHFDRVKTWFAQAGVGVEYRFTPRVGVFLDARGVLANETQYYGVARLGMRFALK